MTSPSRLVSVLTSAPEFHLPPDAVAPEMMIETFGWNDDIGALDASLIVDKLIAGQPVALCIASDVPEALALEISQMIDRHHLDVGVVLVREPTPELWRHAARAGVRDIIDPACVAADLMPALGHAAERGERLREARRDQLDPTPAGGKVIVVLSPKGGSGKTMVSSNLAVALAATLTGEAVLVDLDCVFGDVASVLALVPERTVGQLASLPSFDSTTLKVFLTPHERSGVHVLAGSGLPEEGDAVTAELAGQILEMLKKDFVYVVVDTASGLDERALAAVDRATDIVFIASMDVTSIRNLAKEVSALDRLGLTAARRHFVLNRADARVGLEIPDVEAAIGMKVDAALASSRLVPLCMNQGRTLVLDEPESVLAGQIVAFARTFAPAMERSKADGGDERKSRFSLRRR